VKRLLADIVCILAVLVVQTFVFPLALWRAWKNGVGEGSATYRAALHWDLMVAALFGADEGETVSTYFGRRRSGKVACAFCKLLSYRWPTHCEDAAKYTFVTWRKWDS
jgi:hypothetical protein